MAEKFLVETSARHIHVAKEHLEILFGERHSLTNIKNLSQPGQFACEEKVHVTGPKGTLRMSILGPERPATQVEVSATDARVLGISAPIRESGDTAGSPGCRIAGPAGEIEISCGVIIAKRHIHMTVADAARLGVVDKQIVCVKVKSPDRTTIFCDTVARVSDSFSLAMHLDTDEANAAGLSGAAEGEIVSCG